MNKLPQYRRLRWSIVRSVVVIIYNTMVLTKQQRGVLFNIALILLVACILIATEADEKDFYKLLGVPRDADNRAIRKAFKLLAVKLHPDKNTDDADAQAKFILLTRAYETLKDPDARKHYDLYGDYKESESSKKQQFHSYTYYRDVFGIYDDDPLIITLGLSDFESNVNDPNIAWFVNFYSPQCWHCHELAPAWRKIAAELEGVIRIAAVNCEEDWQLCTQLQIRGYPTLLYYGKEDHMFEGEKYTSSRTVEEMQSFILERLNLQVKSLSSTDWHHNQERKEQWLLFLCGNSDGLCPEEHTIVKLAAMLDGLVPVAKVEDPELCNEIYSDYSNSPAVFWQIEKTNNMDTDESDANSVANVHNLNGFDSHELAKQVLALLPEPQRLDKETFKDVRIRLRLGDTKPWLICFSLGAATELSVQLKKLPAYLPQMNIGIVHCARSADLCVSLHVSHYPAWGVLKEGGAFEMHHGKDTLHEVAAFARDSSQAINLHELSPADYHNLLKEGSPWFIDWYAPWCPPCQRLMPELRRASQHFDSESVKFGTVDCTLHSAFCSQQGIRSYPTVTFYNKSKTQYFHGRLQEQTIVEFVQDMLNPIVISLTKDSFRKKLSNKSSSELWMVDFFAPWCGPCQKLSSHWRTLAKEVSYLDEVYIAEVDCVAEAELCTEQNIRSYPTIRLYPLGGIGLNTVAIYNGHRDSASMKRWLLGFLPTPVLELDVGEFNNEVLNMKNLPWLIDFYAPWCGHCHHFEPEFITVARKLEGIVHSGKLNCELYKNFCREQHVHSYPTVLLYVSPSLRYEIDSQNAQHIIDRVKSLLSKLKHKIHDEF